MGGQACILYGAAEFSRDVNLAVLADENNLQRLRRALQELRAEPIFFPPPGIAVLQKEHACHFRAKVAQAHGLRIDVMSALHGCEPFAQLWRRRKRLNLLGVGRVNVLALADLVQAKKTQRGKDWPMIRRLVEVDFHNRPARPSTSSIHFWLREARTPELLIDLSRRYPARRLAKIRPALLWAIKGNAQAVEESMRQEQEAIRAVDRAYWQPLRDELFRMRQAARS
jgi:hypothetical protein